VGKEGESVRLYLETLDDKQLALLPTLAPFSAEEGFYLAGGTAVALQLGHRHSVDFDFFTPEAFDEPLLLPAVARARGIAMADAQVARRSLHAVAGGVRLSFFGYPYALLEPPVETDYGLRMAGLDDIGCMKLAAIAQRGLKKDFVDVYALLRMHAALARMLENYQRKYATKELFHVLHGLDEFRDAESQPMPEMIWDVTWDQVKASIRRSVAELAPGC